jgi:predicted transposase/invertase (TIGR01784 family)
VFLIDFLNSLLKGERIITDLQYLDKEQAKQSVEERTIIYDIFCKTDNGDQIIVEMQNCSQPYFQDRSIFYLSKAIAEQGVPGSGWKYDISAVYCISLLNETAPEIPQKFRTDVMLSDIETSKIFSDKVRLVYLQLPFFDKKEDECVTNLDKWIYNLKHMERLTQLPFGADGGVFKLLDEVTDVDSLNKEERREYEHTLKVFRDLRGAMDGADLKGFRRGMEEGMQKGMEKGIQKGMEKGIQKGMEEGMQKGMEKGIQKGIQKGMEKGILQTARNMKALGISIDTIKQVTHLTDEEIQSI